MEHLEGRSLAEHLGDTVSLEEDAMKALLANVLIPVAVSVSCPDIDPHH